MNLIEFQNVTKFKLESDINAKRFVEIKPQTQQNMWKNTFCNTQTTFYNNSITLAITELIQNGNATKAGPRGQHDVVRTARAAPRDAMTRVSGAVRRRLKVCDGSSGERVEQDIADGGGNKKGGAEERSKHR